MGWAEAIPRFHRYPYRQEEFDVHGRPLAPRPTVDVKIEHGDLTRRFRALIDTGAPKTIFDCGIAAALGIELGLPGATVDQVVMLGGTHPAERHFVHLTLPPFDDVTWEAEVSFLQGELDLPFAGCLGTEGFLDRWVVSFNAYDNFFVVEERDSFMQRVPRDLLEDFGGRMDDEWSRPRPT